MGKSIVFLAMVIGVAWFFRASQPNALPPKHEPTGEERADISKAPRTAIDPFDGVSGSVRTPNAAVEQLTFSNTMRWGQKYRDMLTLPAPIIGTGEASIRLPDFPAQSSLRTEMELQLLRQYVLLRTPERVAQIQGEVNLDGARIGPETLRGYIDNPCYQKTGQAFSQMNAEIEAVVLRLKALYNRVRPNQLDPTLTTVIDVPEHPAYPSGHSTQAYAAAFLFTVLAPERQAEFESDALRIAVNREIAGVHYPSDTAAGQLLARQIVDSLLQNQDFAALVEAAKREWQPKE
jgi:hypothetical protein